MESLVGIAEIAELYGVKPAAVTNWRKRFADDFPQPVTVLKAGPIFRADDIDRWIRRRHNMDTKCIATINLKGGVAKTTTTVGLAQFLASEHGKKVLVIDLDPQTNATTMLIGEERWLELNNAGYTLAALFSDAINEEERFDLEHTLQKGVGTVTGMTTLDLLPSSLNLIDLQDRLITIPTGPFGTRNPVAILLRGIKDILKNYDYILIDCPPNLGYITLNGLRIADGYLIPTIPDVMSTYGIPQIVTRIHKFANEISTEKPNGIVPIGIVPTKVRPNTNLHRSTLASLRSQAGKVMEEGSDLVYPPIFDTIFSERTALAEAAEFSGTQSSLSQKWGKADLYETFTAFTKEFITVCGEL